MLPYILIYLIKPSVQTSHRRERHHGKPRTPALGEFLDSEQSKLSVLLFFSENKAAESRGISRFSRDPCPVKMSPRLTRRVKRSKTSDFYWNKGSEGCLSNYAKRSIPPNSRPRLRGAKSHEPGAKRETGNRQGRVAKTGFSKFSPRRFRALETFLTPKKRKAEAVTPPDCAQQQPPRGICNCNYPLAVRGNALAVFRPLLAFNGRAL